MRCYSDEHDALTALAYALIGLWPVGSVALFGGLVLLARARLRLHTADEFTHAIRFLHQDFTTECFYWSIVELVQRQVLVGWVLLVPTDKTFLRIVAALL
eukprot:5655022-Prymnesium_polylepis.1